MGGLKANVYLKHIFHLYYKIALFLQGLCVHGQNTFASVNPTLILPLIHGYYVNVMKLPEHHKSEMKENRFPAF